MNRSLLLSLLALGLLFVLPACDVGDDDDDTSDDDDSTPDPADTDDDDSGDDDDSSSSAGVVGGAPRNPLDAALIPVGSLAEGTTEASSADGVVFPKGSPLWETSRSPM